ncbi:MAG: TrmH family RNA methyltransferase [Candidatus Paceibacterota bacterium]
MRASEFIHLRVGFERNFVIESELNEDEIEIHLRPWGENPIYPVKQSCLTGTGRTIKIKKQKSNIKDKRVCLILHNIRSTHNVGSIFRTADAVGVSKIFLTGYTPAPVDRFGREVKEISKTALGAEKNIEWEKVKNIDTLIKKLKKEKVLIIGVEQSKKSIDYKKVSTKDGPALGWKGNSVFIFGNEVNGLPKSILNKCDIIAEIPMKGKKESLNVSVSAGVVLFRILNI